MISASASDQLIATQLICIRIGVHSLLVQGAGRWEEGGETSILEFAATEHGRKGKVVAGEDVKTAIQNIGINKCSRESAFDRKNLVRKLVRGIPVKRTSYNEFVRLASELQVMEHAQSTGDHLDV
jgi:hypothetical protein